MLPVHILSGAQQREMKRIEGQIHFFLEQAEGYVKAPQKSTSRVLNWREVFEHCAQND
jgi:hypothetical protein